MLLRFVGFGSVIQPGLMPMVVPNTYLLEQSQFKQHCAGTVHGGFCQRGLFSGSTCFLNQHHAFHMQAYRAHYHSPACFSCYNEGSVSISIRNPLVSGLKHFQMVLDAGKQFVSGVPKKDFNTMHI